MLGSDNNALQQAWHQDVTERLEYEVDQRRSGMDARGRSKCREKGDEELRERKYLHMAQDISIQLLHGIYYSANPEATSGTKLLSEWVIYPQPCKGLYRTAEIYR